VIHRRSLTVDSFVDTPCERSFARFGRRNGAWRRMGMVVNGKATTAISAQGDVELLRDAGTAVPARAQPS
jgi:hypothetical protein